MSWEDDRVDERPCPCGKGVYTITHRSNDWMQHEERWAMVCSRCKTTYGLHQHAYTDRDGIHDVAYYWVPKPDLRELADLQRSIDKQQRELTTFLSKQYGSRWIAHFEGKSKKAIWAALTGDGADYPQLSTFYDHVRRGSLEGVLNGYLRYESAHVVSRILGLDDSELSSRVQSVRQLRADAAAKEQRIRSSGFR
jgi:hypothetical protein